METEFRTFCHISDYGEYGYQRLHRLVAGSKPLLLWSPSSVLLRSEGSIAVKDYIKLLEEGDIRIIGRAKWLFDREARNSHRWEGARWDNYIDEAVRRVYVWDLAEADVRKKRVIVADEEPGQEWAESIVGSDPTQIGFWQSILDSEDVTEHIPPGTLEAIQKQQLGPEAATIRILRDARNHGQAVRDAMAETPFLLNPADARILKILNEMRGLGTSEEARPSTQAASPDAEKVAEITDALAVQMIDILERLDECRGEGSLMKFFHRGGHEELVNWLVELKELFRQTPTEKALIRALGKKLELSKRDGLRMLFDGALATSLTGVGTIGAANTAAQALEDASLQNLLGLAVESLVLGFGTLRTLGFIEGSYTGPQWPYLYTYGKKANWQRRKALLDNLSNAN